MKVNQLKGGAILSYLAVGLNFIVSMIYTPFMLRTLGQSEYGLYNLVASVVSYFGLLSFGFGSAYVRFYSRYKVQDDKGNIARLNGMYLIIFSMIGLIAILAGSFLVANLRIVLGNKLTMVEINNAKVLMALMVVNIAIAFPSSVFSSHITVNERFVFQKVLVLIMTIINPLLMLPVLLLGYGSIGLVVVTFLLNLALVFTNIRFCLIRLKMRFNFRHFDMPLMKEMTMFSSFIFLHIIMDQALWSVDKYILGRIWGTATVAVYSVAATINAHYLSFSIAISSVFVPRVNNIFFSMDKEDANRALTVLMIRVGRIQLMILSLILLGIIFFGQQFFILWAGETYRDSYYIAMILIIPVTFPLIQNLGISIQRAKSMQKFLAVVNALIAVLNVLISIPLAKMFGGAGSALGTSIAMIIGNILIANWYYHYRMGLDMKKFWIEISRIIPAMILPIIFGIILYLLVDLYSIRNFIIFGIIFVIVYIYSVWRYGMNENEKNLIRNPLKRMYSRMR